ncbi:MAG: D-tyrosyl-tRNA(Tyr) deacylase [Deltaproteobacteria bacterium]|nr:MAG: D-tyrosyl-tRNA(Tyr) deacylase [Deltaproteobacteria bacterium]
MRAVVQRVDRARVTVAGRVTGEIGRGLLVFLGVARDDTERDVEYLARKVTGLRIFPDEAGRFNRSLRDIGGAILVVSQFTLFGDCRKGRRPSFVEAAPPQQGRELYERFVEAVGREVPHVATGEFQAMMRVELVNDGPVTLLLDSTKHF